MHEPKRGVPKAKLSPLYMDVILNEVLKLVFVTGIFFLQYWIFYTIIKSQTTFVQISLLVFINFIATMISHVLAYIVIKKILYQKYASRGFFSLNDLSDRFYYILISLVVNPIVSAFFVYDFLFELNLNISIIIFIWFGIKVFFALLEYFVSAKMKANVVLSGLMLILFLILIFTASSILKELI